MFQRTLSSFANHIGHIGAFLWSGWAGPAAVSLLFAAWQAGHEAYGPFILTSPIDQMRAVSALAVDPAAWQIAALTLQRAVTGFLLVAGAGA
ncbi:MAG: hypothetical protein AAGE76_01255 [Pseudomonadota bacterium]